ncbi:hypothetical protein D2Q93_16330 [Alicyclobacillaceae bacterium I2511]|nr:hypothetical protein D2Q93_16330 [Alicyclobacillaceae bacterium I2511]
MEAIVIFDNVFVPYERVFMQGEWEFAGLLAASFANYHRFTAAAYKYPYVELLVGAAHLMAETNGVDGVSHIRDKIAMLTMYAETISALSLAAVEHPKIGPDTGMAYPNPVLSNAVKFYFADHYHEAIKALQDIAGGIIVTAPSTRDFLSDQTRPDLQRFLTGKEGVSVEDRWRIIKLVRDLVASDLSGLWEVTTLHAEGSLAAQRLATVRASDVQRYRAVASHAAGLD